LTPITPVNLPGIVLRALAPGRFFLREGLRLDIAHGADQTLSWEVYRGHLLDPALTRQREPMESWEIRVAPDQPPLVSVRWQHSQQLLHVTRSLLLHAFEGYEASPGVILSRPIEKWTAELVGTIAPARRSMADVESQLARLILLAVIGTSRLPITSLESPLPAFSLGTFGYLSGSQATAPCSDPRELVRRGLSASTSGLERAKSLELALRAIAPGEAGGLADVLEITLPPDTAGRSAARLLREVFNGAALSPYTDFVGALLALVDELSRRPWFGPQASLNTLSYMLRHLVRHLTAYDLSLFHSFGANYPDALFLDALVKAYLRLIESRPELIAAPGATLARRALRQGLLLRHQYEGHRVPDAPTSMGENARVLPEPFVRVPEQQITDPAQRRRKLFADDPTDALLGPAARAALKQSMQDLQKPGELVELGLALFLDRPLGVHYEAGAVDRSPLVSYEAYSRFIARRRLAAIKSLGWIDRTVFDELSAQVKEMPAAGIAITDLAPVERPGVVSLADAVKAAPDFRLLRSTRSSLDTLLGEYDLTLLEQVAPETHKWLTRDRSVLLVCGRSDDAPTPRLIAFEAETPRLEFGFVTNGEEPAYRQRAGVEVPPRLELLSLRRGVDAPYEDTRNRGIELDAR